MTLQSIMAEIKRLKPLADTEVAEHPRETLGGRLSRQKRAKEELKGLTETYRRALLNSALFILVTGTARDLFVEKATSSMGFFSADPEQFYKDIAGQVSPQLYLGKESSPNVLDVVTRILENKAMDVGITGYPMVTFRQEYRRVIKSKEEFVALVKQILNVQVGAEVVAAQAVKTVLPAAMSAGHEAKTTPILMSVESIDEATVKALMRVGGVGIIQINGEEVTEEDVLSTMGEIRRQRDSGMRPMETLVELERQVAANLAEKEASLLEASGLTVDQIADLALQNQADFGADGSAYGTEASVAPVEGGQLTQEMVEAAALKAIATGHRVKEEPSALKQMTAKERKALEKANKNK